LPQPLGLDDPTTRITQRLRPDCRRDPARPVPVAIAASRLTALVASRAQGLGQLFLEHPLNGFEDPAAHLRLDALAEARQSAPPVVAFDMAWPPIALRDLWRQLGGLRHLTFSTGLSQIRRPR